MGSEENLFDMYINIYSNYDCVCMILLYYNFSLTSIWVILPYGFFIMVEVLFIGIQLTDGDIRLSMELFLFSCPPVRGVCSNHEVVMFQPRTVTPPYLGSVINCYVATPFFLTRSALLRPPPDFYLGGVPALAMESWSITEDNHDVYKY